jgi:predicted RNase H-like HicB family nuclease
MAGTMPHAIFVETGLDGGATVAAYAAELPGCATFAETDEEATQSMPRRVAAFTAWLRANGQEAPTFVGDNWYEVERAAAADGGRAAFTLDELPPSDEEFARYQGWLELAREELAEALDIAPGVPSDPIEQIAHQDERFTRELGGPTVEAPADPVDHLYAARDALTDALAAAGPGHDAVRRIVRIAVADDLRLADALRGVIG